MDVITMARELGKEIQKDERYLAMQVARQQSDNDRELQDLIGDFNLKRISLSAEASKEDRDDEKVQALNTEMRQAYAKIMRNPNMTAYNQAKEAMDALLKRVNAIITLSSQGADPETADYDESCGGDCSGCSGCH